MNPVSAFRWLVPLSERERREFAREVGILKMRSISRGSEALETGHASNSCSDWVSSDVSDLQSP